MKQKILILSSLLFLLIISACKDKVYNKYLANTPIYMSYEDFRSSLNFEAPHDLTTKGSIYIKDNYLFVSEPNKGVHIIDNSDPSNPINKGFIKILGNTGLLIKGNYLYANSFIDLVVIDISNILAPKEIKRLENVFPASLPLTVTQHPITSIDKSLGVVINWEVKEVKEKVEQSVYGNGCPECAIFTAESNNIQFSTNSSTNSNGASNQGISGSITKLTLVNDYLYVMEGNVLIPFDLSNPTNPIAKDGQNIWRSVETLFAYNSHIFMGTTTGMLIYDTSNPDQPNYISSVNHMRGCDPVVIENDIAYVTVRSGGTRCSGILNQLDVIDVSNVSNPHILKSFPLTNPHGLGIDGTALFICDGSDGLKLFNATDPLTVGNNLSEQFNNIQATDIIPFNNIAIVIGDDGIYQYDYSDQSNLELLSKINF